MPTICGEPVKFSNKALTPFSQLLHANSYTSHSNIRVAATTRPLGAQIQSLRQGIQPQKITPTAPCQAAVTSQLVPSIEPPRLQPSARVVPIFQPKPTQKSAIQTAQGGSSQHQKPIVPTFKPTFTSKAASSQQLNVSSQKVAHSITPRAPSQTVPTSRAPSSKTSQTVPSMSAGAISKPRPAVITTQGSASVNKPATKRPNSSAVPPPSKRPCLIQNQTNPQSHGPNMSIPSQQIVPDLSDGLLQSSHEVSFMESSSTKTPVNKPTATPGPQKKNSLGPQKKSSVGAEVRCGTLKSPPCYQLIDMFFLQPKAVKQTEPLRVEGVPEDVIKKVLATCVPHFHAFPSRVHVQAHTKWVWLDIDMHDTYASLNSKWILAIASLSCFPSPTSMHTHTPVWLGQPLTSMQYSSPTDSEDEGCSVEEVAAGEWCQVP